MAEHPIQGMMGVTIDKIREMVDTSTIIGEPIHPDDKTTIIPVSKVTFGFASGGTDGTNVRYGAGAGAGVTITPVAFIVVNQGNVRMIYVEPPTNSALDKALDMVPQLVDKFKKDKPEESTEY